MTEKNGHVTKADLQHVETRLETKIDSGFKEVNRHLDNIENKKADKDLAVAAHEKSAVNRDSIVENRVAIVQLNTQIKVWAIVGGFIASTATTIAILLLNYLLNIKI